MQGRRDLIPDEVAERRLKGQFDRQRWTQRARTLVDLGRYTEAAHDYVKGVLESLEQERVFSAAYYLKELFKEDLVNRLFESALQDATDSGDLWWQIRSLQELKWDSELKDLLLSNKEQIESSDDRPLISLLRHAQGDEEASNQVSIEFPASSWTLTRAPRGPA